MKKPLTIKDIAEIAFIGGSPAVYMTGQRVNAFRETLQQAGIAAENAQAIETKFYAHHGYEARKKLLASGRALPQALLAGIDQLFVVFGVLWGIIPIALINLQVNGGDVYVRGQFGAALGGAITDLLRVKTYSFLPVLNVFELGLFSGPDSKAIYEVIAIVVAFSVPVILTILYGKSRVLVPATDLR